MKNKIKRIHIKEHINQIREDLVVDKLNAIEWSILALILLFISLTLFYVDNLGMFLTYFWVNEELFKSGSIRFLGNNQLPYGIVQQWFCELWVLPLNILRRFFDFSSANTLTVIWFKLSMAFIMTLCMAELKKVAQILGIQAERIKWMLILFTSTILVALPVFHIAQSDILYTYISLIAIREYLKGNHKRFLIYFALAISCKAIAVIIFIPLILLKEKRIIYIIRDSVAGVTLFLVERVWYKIIDKIDTLIRNRTTQYVVTKTVVVETAQETVETVVEKSIDQTNTDFFSHFYNKALFFEFPAIRKGYMASLLVTLFVLLCIWCYVQKKEEEREWMQKSLYAVSIAWLIFFANSSPSPYWIVAMYPAVFLLIFMQPDRIKTNMLVQSCFTLTMFLVYVVNTEWVYGGSCNLDYLLFKGLLKEGHDSVDGPFVARYLYNLGIEKYMNIVTAICLAAAIGFAVINYHRTQISDGMTEADEKKTMHGFAIWQIAFLGIWYIANVWVVQRW